MSETSTTGFSNSAHVKFFPRELKEREGLRSGAEVALLFHRMNCCHTYVWGRAIKIGARSFWGRGVFVLVISNVNIGYQKSLTPSLSRTKFTITEFPNIYDQNIVKNSNIVTYY